MALPPPPISRGEGPFEGISLADILKGGSRSLAMARTWNDVNPLPASGSDVLPLWVNQGGVGFFIDFEASGAAEDPAFQDPRTRVFIDSEQAGDSFQVRPYRVVYLPFRRLGLQRIDELTVAGTYRLWVIRAGSVAFWDSIIRAFRRVRLDPNATQAVSAAQSGVWTVGRRTWTETDFGNVNVTAGAAVQILAALATLRDAVVNASNNTVGDNLNIGSDSTVTATKRFTMLNNGTGFVPFVQLQHYPMALWGQVVTAAQQCGFHRRQEAAS